MHLRLAVEPQRCEARAASAENDADGHADASVGTGAVARGDGVGTGAVARGDGVGTGAVARGDGIAALVQGGRHRDAIGACAREHGAVLGRLCMALLGSQADADEAVQETLLRAHRGLASYRGEGSVKAWLCGIARHVCAHTLESRQRDREVFAQMSSGGEDGHDRHDGHDRPENLGHAGWRARAMRRALEQLRPTEREALVLRYVADLSHRELGAALRLDEAAARKRISRAIAHLRAVMPDRAPDQEID